jgi:hypothetical protein
MTEKTLTFHSTFSSNNLQLFEVSDSLLTAFLSGEVRLKGPPDGHAVLTTDDETYTLKRQENSNKQYIVSDSVIHGQPGSVIKLERLYTPNVSVALVPETSADKAGQTRLFAEASASDMEIRHFLENHPEVLEDDGHFYRVSAGVKAEAMRAVIIAAASIGPSEPLNHETMPVDDDHGGHTSRPYDIEEIWVRASDAFSSESSSLTLGIVRSLLASISDSIDIRFARFNNDKLKRALVWQVVALNRAEYFTLTEAVEAWVSALSLAPLTTSADETMRCLDGDNSETSELLRYGRGLFVTEDLGNGQTLVRVCHVATLAAEPRTRLKELFAVNKKWERPDLVTYLAAVLGEESAVDGFLLKLTRQNMVGEKKLYSSLFLVFCVYHAFDQN